jgi:hypothetical protein
LGVDPPKPLVYLGVVEIPHFFIKAQIKNMSNAIFKKDFSFSWKMIITII